MIPVTPPASIEYVDKDDKNGYRRSGLKKDAPRLADECR